VRAFFQDLDFGGIVLIVLIAAYLILLPIVAFIGLEALSDYNFRGCPVEEANQCSDARGAMYFAMAYAVPLVLSIATFLYRKLRKPAEVDKNA
jgi:hypothetical protein